MASDRFQYKLIVAGFGGQGVMVIGNLLSYAAMIEGKYVTYLPVYGVEMRGGTANFTVVISSHDILRRAWIVCLFPIQTSGQHLLEKKNSGCRFRQDVDVL